MSILKYIPTLSTLGVTIVEIDIEEEKQRREGKGRRCCLDDGIYSILLVCHSTDLAPG